MYFGTLTNMADNVQLYKYAVQMVTNSFGKTATFMLKPVKGITDLECTATNQFGKATRQFSWAKNIRVYLKKLYIILEQHTKTRQSNKRFC